MYEDLARRSKGRRRKVARQWHLLQVRLAGTVVQGAGFDATIDEISVKSFFRTPSGIARCTSKLLYCAVTVLRDRIRVPDEL
jgi:hypothetical protein